MDIEKKCNHGGARSGAGRKTKYEKTIVKRVPEKYWDVIEALISHLDDTAQIDRHYKPVTSDGVFLRSLQDKKQQIKFVTAPMD